MANPLFPFYAELWHRAEREGVWVHYDGPSPLYGEAGYFDHRGGKYPNKHPPFGEPGPSIGICRLYYPEPIDVPSEYLIDGRQADLVSELVTFAHEYGHFRSFNGETPRLYWDRYFAAADHRDDIVNRELKAERLDRARHRELVSAQLSAEEKALIVAEEELAWRTGRPFLPESLLADLDRRAQEEVHGHRYRLGIETSLAL